MSAPRPVAAVPAILLVLVAVWEIAATRCDAHAVPGDDAWKDAAAVVRAGYRPGDLIVFAPEWADPIGRLHLGDLIPVELAARMDAARFGRIWEVSIRGAHHAEVAGLAPVAEESRGGVRVARYERTPAAVVSDVREQVGTAQTTGAARGPVLVLAEVGFAPRRCIQLVPQPNAPARLAFPQLALGTELVGYVGIADVFTRRDQRAPARLDVEIGGTVVASATAGVDDGWVRFSAPTTPGTADVTFIASSAAANRLVCFAAEARR